VAPDGRNVVARAVPRNGAPRLHLLDVEGSTRPLTPDGVADGATGWAVAPDGTMVAVSSEQGLQLFPISRCRAPRAG
jgi:hypothetical protein